MGEAEGQSRMTRLESFFDMTAMKPTVTNDAEVFKEKVKTSNIKRDRRYPFDLLALDFGENMKRSNGQGGVRTTWDTGQYRSSGRFAFVNKTTTKPVVANDYKGFMDRTTIRYPAIDLKGFQVDPGDTKGMQIAPEDRYFHDLLSEPLYEEATMKRSIEKEAEVFKEMEVDPGDTGQYHFAGVPFLAPKLRVETDSEFVIDPGDTDNSVQRGSTCHHSELLFYDTPTRDPGQLHPSDRGYQFIVDEPVAMRPIVDHISRVMENIRANTLCIAFWEPDNPASNIPQLHDYSAIIEVWEELASRVHRPAEFLSIWHRVEDYERFILELQVSISDGANTMTEDMAHDFCRRLGDFVSDFKANAKATDDNDGALHPSLQAASHGGPSFFKDIGKVNILGGYFVMNNQQADIKILLSQFEVRLKVITNCVYLQLLVVLF